ncbi:MAG: hypothetical protein FJ304_05510 [Planctomycetes bacterium]|nr:hypothetical protein [Planctomycetota bacterium]
MKRFFGWGLVLAGGAVGGWGVISVLRGSTSARLNVTPDLSVSALTAGLAGVAVLTIGLVWVRD